MIQAAEHSVEAIMDEPFPESIATPEQWRLQLTHIIDRRSRIYEHLLPIYLAALSAATINPHPQQTRKRSCNAKKTATKRGIASCVAPRSTTIRGHRRNLGHRILGQLRHSQNLSARQARSTVEIAIDKLTGYSA